MNYIIPSSIKKTIRFPRLTFKNVSAYEVYTKTVDNTYDSGIRIDLLDRIDNLIMPSPIKTQIDLEYSNNATWSLPKDIYMDKDHSIIVLVDGVQISKLYYTINKQANMFTINQLKVKINTGTKVSLIYYQDIIEKSYMLDNECGIFVKPVIRNSYHYGHHNVIL